MRAYVRKEMEIRHAALRRQERDRIATIRPDDPLTRISRHKARKARRRRVGPLVVEGVHQGLKERGGRIAKCQGSWPLDKAIRLMRKEAGKGGPSGITKMEKKMATRARRKRLREAQ